MSLILDALNKAEQDETVNQQRANGNQISTYTNLDTPENNRSTHWSMMAIIALLIIIGALLAVIALKDNTSSTANSPENSHVSSLTTIIENYSPTTRADTKLLSLPPTATTTVNIEQTTPDQILNPSSHSLLSHHHEAQIRQQETAQKLELTHTPDNPQNTDKSPTPTVVPEEITALYSTQQTPAAVAPKKQLKNSSRAKNPSVSSAEQDLAQALWDASELDTHTPLPKSVKRDTTIVPEPKQPTPKQETITDAPYEDTLGFYEKVPFLHELSTSTQNTIPTLMYSEHQYINGYVVLNKQTLQAGDITKTGIKIEKILADGVLLKFSEKTFKLALMSSWVNF